MIYRSIFYFIFISGFALMLQNCKTDPCEAQYCYNGGTCVNGNCVCPAGGDAHCDTLPSNWRNTMGVISFYAAAPTGVSLGSCVPYQITIAGQTGSITNENGLVGECPQPASDSSFTLTLAPGTYTYTAKASNGELIRGNVNLTVGQCVGINLNCSADSLGAVTFYLPYGSAANTPVGIVIAGYNTQSLTQYSNTPQNCNNPSNCANYTLPAGNYTATIYSGPNFYRNYSFTVNIGGCNIIFIN